MRTLVKTAIGIITVISMLLQTAIPVNAKKAAPCCSCCRGSVCMCACNNKGSVEAAFQGVKKDSAHKLCDFNTCNKKYPATPEKSFLLNISDNILKKKLVLGLKTCALEEGACLFAKISTYNLYAVHLSLPPPLFLKHSSFLL
jgi:hypothetical protein